MFITDLSIHIPIWTIAEFAKMEYNSCEVIHMNGILRQIYEGEFHMEENHIPKTEAYVRQRAKTIRLESDFFDQLPRELQADFEELTRERILLTGIEVEEGVLEGMRIGAQIANALGYKPEGIGDVLEEAIYGEYGVEF